MTYKFDCRLFTGYKPCQYKRPCQGCPHHDPVAERIVIVSLEALGAVLRSTCLLGPIKRRYPKSHITWVTLPSAKPLLENNPYIDRLMALDTASAFALDQMRFDVLYAVDKSLEVGAIAQRIKAKAKFGFGLNEDGVIVPLTEHGAYHYALGLDDELKFFKNEKAETQVTTETMGLLWERDPYVLRLTEAEKVTAAERRAKMLQGKRGIIGFNTGCSHLYAYKKFTVERSIETIRMWRRQFPDYVVALLGGREDTERQESMKAAFATDSLVVNTATVGGLRSGVVWMEACDFVFSGDSLGMHIAIGLGKPTIAWFGVSCMQEIDLYDRGAKIKADVTCTPCWRKSCTNEPKCYNMVSVARIEEETRHLLERFGRNH